MAYMEQTSPKYAELDKSTLAGSYHSLGIDNEGLMADTQPCVVNTGNSFLVIGLKNKASVSAVVPDFESISQISDEFDLIGYYVFLLRRLFLVVMLAHACLLPDMGLRKNQQLGWPLAPSLVICMTR